MSDDESADARTYEISRFGSSVPCTCSPETAGAICPCHGSTNPWLRAESTVSEHATMLVAYIRVADDLFSQEEQTISITEYCLDHGFAIAATFVEIGKPSYRLQEALQTMTKYRGLIAVNLQSFVENEEDRLRSLRPFVHHFFCSDNQRLITIAEGIDTSTSSGQNAAEMALDTANEEYNT